MLDKLFIVNLVYTLWGVKSRASLINTENLSVDPNWLNNRFDFYNSISVHHLDLTFYIGFWQTTLLIELLPHIIGLVCYDKWIFLGSRSHLSFSNKCLHSVRRSESETSFENGFARPRHQYHSCGVDDSQARHHR